VPHGSEVLRQHRQTGAGLCRLLQQLSSAGQIERNVSLAGHLYHG
jgi:hypothetical protein